VEALHERALTAERDGGPVTRCVFCLRRLQRVPDGARLAVAVARRPRVDVAARAAQLEVREHRATIVAAVFHALQRQRAAAVREAVAIATGAVRAARQIVFVFVVGVLIEVVDEHFAFRRLIDEPALIENARFARHNHVAFFGRREQHFLFRPVVA